MSLHIASFYNAFWETLKEVYFKHILMLSKDDLSIFIFAIS